MKHLKLLAVLLLSLILSCEDKIDEFDTSKLDNKKEEAKTFFESQIKPNLGFQESNSRTNSLSRVTIAEDLNWDKAWIRELSFGTGLAVPIRYQTEFFSPITSDSVISLTNSSYVLFLP